MVLLQDTRVLSEESLLLVLDYLRLHFFLSLLLRSNVQLDSALGPVNRQFLLPKALDLALVLLLTHALLLLVHLFDALVLCELLKQFLLEVLFKALLLSQTLGLQSHLELFGFLELAPRLVLLVLGLLLSVSGGELVLLDVELVPQVFLEFLLGASLHFLLLETLEDGFAGLLGIILGLLNLVEALLLLFGVLPHHFVFEGFHLGLALQQSTLLVHRQNHIGLSLLHLKVLNAGHFAILSDHPLNDSVDLVLLLDVLLLRFDFQLFAVGDLLLDSRLIRKTVDFARLFGLTVDLVLDLFGAKHNLVDLGVLLL